MQFEKEILPLIWLTLMFGWSYSAAAVAYFIYWCIGSPTSKYGVEGGRIASHYGIWLEKKYNEVNLNHENKLLQIYSDKIDRLAALEYEDVFNKTQNTDISDQMANAIYMQANYFEYREQLGAGAVKLNWYKALGMCVHCMAVYVAWILISVVQVAGYMPNIGVNKWVNIAFILLLTPAISNVFLKKMRS